MGGLDFTYEMTRRKQQNICSLLMSLTFSLFILVPTFPNNTGTIRWRHPTDIRGPDVVAWGGS